MDYDPHLSKSSTLRSPTLRVINALLTGMVMDWGFSTGTISRHDFVYLLSMADGVPYHLRYVISTTLHHKATGSQVRVIFAKPYITQLIRGINLLEEVDRMWWVGSFTPITKTTCEWLVSLYLQCPLHHLFYPPHLVHYPPMNLPRLHILLSFTWVSLYHCVSSSFTLPYIHKTSSRHVGVDTSNLATTPTDSDGIEPADTGNSDESEVSLVLLYLLFFIFGLVLFILFRTCCFFSVSKGIPMLN